MSNTTEHLKKSAFEILKQNDRGEYSVPTRGLYPVQFNWDSAFAALGYLWSNQNRAWRELELLTEAQWPDGMIPHIIFRGEHEGYFPGPAVWRIPSTPPTSGITQPPFLATALRHLVENCDTLETPRVVAVLKRIHRWHCWFMENRLDDNSGAIRVVHPWESGRDNLVDWNQGMLRIPLTDLEEYQRRDLEHVKAAQRPGKMEYDRYLSIIKFCADLQWDQKALGKVSPFLMVDPGITAILLRANRDLKYLLEIHQLIKESEQISGFIGTLEKGWRNLWNPKIKAITAYDPIEQKWVDGISSASFLGPYAGVHDAFMTTATLEHFDRIRNQVKYLMPSYDPEHPSFEADRYWRGPVWLMINRLIGKGFAEIGETERAEIMRQDSLALVQQSGFCEYYNPLNGVGLGGKSFTWTAAVFLDWVLAL